MGGDLVTSIETHRPSLRSDHSFNAVEFTCRCLPWPKIVTDDYRSLHNKSSSYLTRLSEVHMLRCLLIESKAGKTSLVDCRVAI